MALKNTTGLYKHDRAASADMTKRPRHRCFRASPKDSALVVSNGEQWRHKRFTKLSGCPSCAYALCDECDDRSSR